MSFDCNAKWHDAACIAIVYLQALLGRAPASAEEAGGPRVANNENPVEEAILMVRFHSRVNMVMQGVRAGGGHHHRQGFGGLLAHASGSQR